MPEVRCGLRVARQRPRELFYAEPETVQLIAERLNLGARLIGRVHRKQHSAG